MVVLLGWMLVSWYPNQRHGGGAGPQGNWVYIRRPSFSSSWGVLDNLPSSCQVLVQDLQNPLRQPSALPPFAGISGVIFFILGLCWLMLALCWYYVGPSWLIIFCYYVGIDFCSILGRFWTPTWHQKWSKNRLKINQKIHQFFECFLDRFLTILGFILGPKIDQKLIKI